MRIFSLVLVACLCVMCKSKEVLPQDQLTLFVVILKDDFTPKSIQKDIPFETVDYKMANKTLNQWSINFKAASKDQAALKTALLNHPYVINVFTQEQIDRFNLKNSKKAKVGALNGKQATKQ